jgi:hypothetical protein
VESGCVDSAVLELIFEWVLWRSCGLYRQSAHRINITFLTPVSGVNSYSGTSHIKIKTSVEANYILCCSTYNCHINEKSCHSFWSVKIISETRLISIQSTSCFTSVLQFLMRVFDLNLLGLHAHKYKLYI